MEQLFRGGEVPEIDLLDCGKPVLYFPVRHHSPVCSYHLKKAVEACDPDCILIEGPINAQRLIPVLAHPDTKAPVALYYFYRDAQGLVSEEKEDYRCYYPFLDASPELTALRAAAGRGMERSYNDDYLISRSRYFSLLCEKTGMRSFEELWEKYFEIGGLYESTADFVRQMFTYCYLSRLHTSAQELEADGCLYRERFMAERIAEASEKYRRILVVTGGFHTFGLTELLKPCADGKRVEYTGEPVELHCAGTRKGARGKKAAAGAEAQAKKGLGADSDAEAYGYDYGLEDENQGVYPLAYSMEAADALNGYASGMQSPGFYQLVYEGLESGKWKAGEPGAGDDRPEPGAAYEDAVLQQLVSAGRRARQKGEGLSSYDTICALSMAKGLAVLRGKRAPGLYELRDAALASFVKGEVSLSTDLSLRILDEINTGRQVGKLCETDVRPPLLSDFEEQCSG